MLDASMAYKFHARDYDLNNLYVHEIIDAIFQGVTALGGKKPKRGTPPKKVARPDNYKEEDDVPYLRDIAAQAMAGPGTVVIE